MKKDLVKMIKRDLSPAQTKTILLILEIKAPPKENKNKRRKIKTGYINSTPEIDSIKQQVAVKQQKEREKLARAAKRKLPAIIESEDELYGNDSDNSDAACLYCNELYSMCQSGEIWIRCQTCSSWCHTECAGVDKRTKNFICEICTS
ncbi:unnamed protein product [Phaedon cochleariae]|uniref:Zinc finger PHD-type domain-containing protein n=1 Tax=Phaedon cochleariae TaxID=80249 RepID=A0A9N9SDT2_PHACE|nr:unnamed protein product [Phaedon cochleariae]